MALTNANVKEILSKAGVDSEHMKDAVNEIIEGHTTSIEALREERDGYKEKAQKVEDLEKQLEKAQKDLKEATSDDSEQKYKTKYEMLKEEFKEYKKDIEAKATKENKAKAYKDILKEAGISEKRIDAVLKVSDVDSIEFDDEGKVKDKDDLLKSIKEEWSDFIQTADVQGAKTDNPPANTGGSKTLTKDDIMKVKDTSERQKLIKENIDLFRA
jgi:DNA repair exonuclease SbcCD ATPase subunit